LLSGGLPLPFDDELTAGGADVAPSALPHGHGDPAIRQDAREAIDARV
jgi:hypothetical protein